jgi:CRISPR-associated protein Csd1
MSLLQQALRRNAAEQTVTHQRAALIKLVLASHSIIQEDEMEQLQTDRPEPAYHCGRLLAVLEQIQRSALGQGVNTTIVDRFYGTASTAPATVFGTLLKGAQPHLSKLRRSQQEGTAYALQIRLEEVLSQLPTFPRTLKLQEQAIFALGYYHQRAHDRAQAQAHKKQKEQGKTAAPAEVPSV